MPRQVQAATNADSQELTFTQSSHIKLVHHFVATVLPVDGIQGVDVAQQLVLSTLHVLWVASWVAIS